MERAKDVLYPATFIVGMIHEAHHIYTLGSSREGQGFLWFTARMESCLIARGSLVPLISVLF